MADLDDLFHLDRYVGPESLTELCLKLICENLDIISVKGKRGRKLLKGLILPSEISDKILEYVLRHGTEEHDSFFTIFKNLSATKLKRVKIVKSDIVDQSVEILIRHKLVDLELVYCTYLTNCTIEYLNANSENLRRLVWHGIPLILPTRNPAYQERGYIFKAPNLRRLALEYVAVSAQDYNLLLAGLPNLTHLELSNSFHVEDFQFYSLVPNLVSLTLYNIAINKHAESFVNNICHLKHLRHLDISQPGPEDGIFEYPNQILASIVNGLPELVSLDISGTNLAGRGIAERPLDPNSEENSNMDLCEIPGLVSRIHRPLQFLGLYQTAHGACRRRDIPAKLIAGDANEDQILVAARVCMDNKQALLQKVLNDLYHVCRYENCYRMDHALYTVLEAMEKHPRHKHIQISGSATLFFIVKMKEKSEFEVRMKQRIINALLNGMSIHKDEEPMIRNGCLALCHFRIPQDVMSNYEALVKVLLHIVKHTEPEGFVQRIVAHFLNSLACQVEGKEKCLLGKLGCMKTMLELVKYRVKSDIFDEVLTVAWSTMWNMTDETAINCERFLDENGMALFLRCVKQYLDKEEILRNMMGLIGNVAEVQHLRVRLMQERYVSIFANLLRSKNNGIELPYNAAGILAHMASDGVEAWTIETPTRDEVLEYMVEAIERWDLYAERNINYRSFLPLLRLLDVFHTPQCQYWAVWALANLTIVYPSRYCSLVVNEGGIEKLEALMLDPRPYKRVQELAYFVCENCCQYSKNTDDVSVFQSPLDEEYSLDG